MTHGATSDLDNGPKIRSRGERLGITCASLLAVIYGAAAVATGDPNPIRGAKKIAARQRLYDQRWEQVFGANGIANEMGVSEAYRRMGIESIRRTRFSISGEPRGYDCVFPSPTRRQLEGLLESYRQDRQ